MPLTSLQDPSSGELMYVELNYGTGLLMMTTKGEPFLVLQLRGGLVRAIDADGEQLAAYDAFKKTWNRTAPTALIEAARSAALELDNVLDADVACDELGWPQLLAQRLRDALKEIDR